MSPEDRAFTYRCNVCGKNKQHRQPPWCSHVAFCEGCGWGSKVPSALPVSPLTVPPTAGGTDGE